jgi:hypothetical protein
VRAGQRAAGKKPGRKKEHKKVMDESRVKEIAAILEKRRSKKVVEIAGEKSWLRWDDESVKAIARAAAQMSIEGVIEHFTLEDPDDLAIILQAFPPAEMKAEAEQWAEALEAAVQAIVSNVNSAGGFFEGFQSSSYYHRGEGCEVLEIRPAVTDMSSISGKSDTFHWPSIRHFEIKHAIEELAEIFDELQDFGYVEDEPTDSIPEPDPAHFYADGTIKGNYLIIRLYFEPDEDAESVDPDELYSR